MKATINLAGATGSTVNVDGQDLQGITGIVASHNLNEVPRLDVAMLAAQGMQLVLHVPTIHITLDDPADMVFKLVTNTMKLLELIDRGVVLFINQSNQTDAHATVAQIEKILEPFIRQKREG